MLSGFDVGCGVTIRHPGSKPGSYYWSRCGFDGRYIDGSKWLGFEQGSMSLVCYDHASSYLQREAKSVFPGIEVKIRAEPVFDRASTRRVRHTLMSPDESHFIQRGLKRVLDFF